MKERQSKVVDSSGFGAGWVVIEFLKGPYHTWPVQQKKGVNNLNNTTDSACSVVIINGHQATTRFLFMLLLYCLLSFLLFVYIYIEPARPFASERALMD